MMSSKCIFCGQPLGKVIKSKEHVFPVWLLRQLDISDTEITETWFSSLGFTKSQRSHSFGSILLGSICRSCNSGWMSMLEQRIKPIFLRAFEGSVENLVLAKEEATDLASWVLKTAIVLNLSTNYRKLFTPQLIRALYLKHRVPKSCYVDVLYHTNQSEIAWWQSQQIMAFMPSNHRKAKYMEALHKVFRITMTIGSLTFRFCYSPRAVFYCKDTNTHAICISKLKGRELVVPRIDELIDINKHDISLYLDWR